RRALRLQAGDDAIEGAQGNARLLGQRTAAARPAMAPQGVEKIKKTFGARHSASLTDLLPESGSMGRTETLLLPPRLSGHDVFPTGERPCAASTSAHGRACSPPCWAWPWSR